MKLHKVSLAVLALVPGPAFAGETILYQDQPKWVEEAQIPAEQPDNSSPLLVFDLQQRIQDGQLWRYQDTAVKIASPEMLGQFSTIGAQWSPDKGDLIIHEASILRDGQTIDLLAKGMKLEVLRREELLEQRQLTGILSATAAIEGLRVGDIFRLRYSVTSRDEVLGQRVQSITGLPASPLRLGTGRVRAIWPAAEKAKWQVLAKDVTAKPERHGSMMELELPLPVPKQPEMPDDAPARFKPLPVLELSTFQDWGDVSRVFAPLYQPQGKIADGSPLAAEADKIAAATQDPLERTQAALQLVQDQVRYLAVNMNAGNYTPQAPAETWKLRYGDCKAKTLLLLALLDRLGIKAEAVLAKASGVHDLQRHIPSAATFDHVLVRATVDGQPLWLDGTRIGSRIEDIHNTPDLGYILPLRMAGAEPEMLKTHADARPSYEVSIDYDESTSYDLPSVATATVTIRGAEALKLGIGINALDTEKRDEFIESYLRKVVGDGQFTDVSVETSTEDAMAVIKGRGILTTNWSPRDRVRVRRLNGPLANFTFSPDRARAEWRNIPVATPAPFSAAYHVRIQLPDKGKGFTLEGAPDTDVTVAGSHFVSHASLNGGLFTYDERQDRTGAEVPVDEISANRARLAKAKAQIAQVVAPADATRRWNLDKAAMKSSQMTGIEAVLDKKMAEKDPDQAPWIARGSLRQGIGDFKGALADFTTAIDHSSDAWTYMQRARVNRSLGDIPAALADAREAMQLDPSMNGATQMTAELLARQGKADEARAMLDEKIALGGDDSRNWEMEKVQTLGVYADAGEALTLLGDLKDRRPQSASLLGIGCWIKALRGIEVESAVRECTSAIELSASPAGPLDSRAVVFFRLGRFDDALRDLDAALRDAPGQASSLYMRGIVLARLGRKPEGQKDLATALRIDPDVHALYDRAGIKP
ncbi:tetratricopeptide repeat protein [Novosphingobium beihaiensis]|uniref:Tetratricopeptide repeat protein n=1 Tax=Novosphingobium beihaiensis TaxID=2930389 RepID=A0ABT0BM05_9SPHN|nr:tetratricopeptide repeat protein [Novosphingobium beihaiensis]MCJ2185993.1 tetratricopeptide repeat protein [Novosphingobium beihaiensis]